MKNTAVLVLSLSLAGGTLVAQDATVRSLLSKNLAGIPGKELSMIVDALERLRATLPFPLRGIDTDNGSEFINEVLITSAPTTGSSSPDRARIEKTIKPGSRRRTGRWFAGSSATDGWRVSRRARRCRDSTRPRAYS